MRTDCCPCGEQEERVHLAAMDEYHEHFCRQYLQLEEERRRLQELHTNVIWYNFELCASKWRSPWPQTHMGSTLQLHSMRFETVPIRGGRQREIGTFPVYYDGPVLYAPKVPPDILYSELCEVMRDLYNLEIYCTAPYDWAPGGRLFKDHCVKSEGAVSYNNLSSNALMAHG